MSDQEEHLLAATSAGATRRRDDDESDSPEVSLLKRRLRYANQNIEFLQDSHKQTISELHSEVERLKMLNKEQQWRLVLAGHYKSLPDIDVVRQFENLSVQTTEVPPQQDPESIMKMKRLEETNADLKTEVEFLRRANERFKSELLRSSKTMEPTKRPAKLIRSPRSANSAGSIGSRTRFGVGKASSSSVNQLQSGFGKELRLDPSVENKTIHLPALKGVNHSIKHQRRLDVINDRHFN
ncbi:Oidioi.mRNA.OKI2018_I69.chr2.g7589.t1.cds [Oikopleura dioica]|uniref:Oidioi.mRNA.OKI2018_I69.chr2.g7589.t1.cds n=1 Tax=Oikopleura dioica TaxID=34765 RepID=A0ABN7TBE7_OIKDI|nr:Oidioi.mRNA.OKI2018_I69.chr2.g7589.t1.cds [Oikopleura dioica]